MISKPVRWRRTGIAALAGVSLALTALAAQVSPPNVRTVDGADTQGGDKKPGERVAIKLPAATLDQYVGSYKGNDYWFIDVRRDGDSLKARITGQPELEIFAESETTFFWKGSDAQIIFSTDGSGTATLRQFDADMPLLQGDAGGSARAQASLDDRIANQTRQPGTEAALRRTIAATIAGKIDYENMEPLLAATTKRQEADIVPATQRLGPVKSVTFKGVGKQGWDSYDVQFANESLTFYITLGASGKIAGLMALSTP